LVLNYLIQVVCFTYWNFDFKLFWGTSTASDAIWRYVQNGGKIEYFSNKIFFYLLISPTTVSFNVQRIFRREIIKSAVKGLMAVQIQEHSL